MMLGYCFGRLFNSYKANERRKILTWMGLGIIFFFVALRATNLYGDANYWHQQKSMLHTIFSFINTVKYPPSLLFMCMTIGPALLFLAWVGNTRTVFSNIISVYGRVPFLYYILHFYLIHFIAMIFFLIRGHSFAEGWKLNPNLPFKFIIPGEGYSLGIVYIIWLGVIIILYPVCKWFSNYKLKNKKWWLSYL
jgi:uncharacterized membrane protein